MAISLRLAAPDALARARDLIVRGRLPAGARVTESELAARLRVSRTPAREAIRRLLAEGLLVPAGGGARPRVAVAPVSAADAEELYQAAGALEGVAARRLTTIAPAQRRALARALAERERAFWRAARARPLDYDQLFERHHAFHAALMDACAGATTRSLFDVLRPRLERYEWLYAPVVGPDFSATHAEHGEIIASVRRGNAAATERALRRNWFRAGRRMAAALARAGELNLTR